MTFTIELPEELAFQMAALLPAEERSRFAVAAIAEALEARQHEEADCVIAVEAALTDMDAGQGLIAFEDLCRQWDVERAARQTAKKE